MTSAESLAPQATRRAGCPSSTAVCPSNPSLSSGSACSRDGQPPPAITLSTTAPSRPSSWPSRRTVAAGDSISRRPGEHPQPGVRPLQHRGRPDQGHRRDPRRIALLGAREGEEREVVLLGGDATRIRIVLIRG